MSSDPKSDDLNRATVAAYDSYALTYADLTKSEDEHRAIPAVKALIAHAPKGGAVLEIGSGPGWDADLFEAAGLHVRRTDAAQAFVKFQAERGKQAELLDIRKDDFGGPYDAVAALHVLQHVGRSEMSDVLAKVAGALKPGGLFLLSVLEGDGEYVEEGSSGNYAITLWHEDALARLLADKGFALVWQTTYGDTEGHWRARLMRAA